MIDISEFKSHVAKLVDGLYRVISCQSDWNDQFGASRCKVKLADYSGEASLLVAPPIVGAAEQLREGDIIEASIRPKVLSHMPGGTLTGFQQVNPGEVANIARLVPQSACPSVAHASLATLVDLINRIDHTDVAGLLSAVLNDCYKGFVRAQGGWEYHHAFPGGLIVHTVNVAVETERQALLVYPHDRHRVDVLVTGAIFHDLGKAIQVIRGPKHPVRSVFRHELLTLQMLDEPLIKFGDAWPGGGRLLAEILVWLAESPASRKKGHDAEIIHHADILDVKADRAARHVHALTPGAGCQSEAVSF